MFYILLSSPFLFVFGNDRVIRYTGANCDTLTIILNNYYLIKRYGINCFF